MLGHIHHPMRDFGPFAVNGLDTRRRRRHSRSGHRVFRCLFPLS